MSAGCCSSPALTGVDNIMENRKIHIKSHLPDTVDDTAMAESERYQAQALEAIESVDTPEEAEALLRKVTSVAEAARLAKIGAEQERRWKALKLKAERKYGKLLGPAKPGNPGGKPNVTGSNVSGADRKARNSARRIAAVPQEKFDDYVDNDPEPSRDGLLRIAERKRSSSRKRKDNDRTLNDSSGVSRDPQVIDWVRERRREGMTRPEIVQASVDNTHDWPRPDDKLSNGTVGSCYAAIDYLESKLSDGDEEQPKAQKSSRRAKNWNGKTNGKRKTELNERKRNGDYNEMVKLQLEMNKLCSVIEDYSPEDLELDAATLDLISDFYDDLVSLGTWYERSYMATQSWLSAVKIRKTIEALRNTAGRDPVEAASFNKQADRMERKLEVMLEKGVM